VRSPDAEVIAAFELRGAAPFGGLSALLVDGDALLAASDRGLLWSARLRRDPLGRVTSIDGWYARQVLLPGGRQPRGLDLEAIARRPDGGLTLAVESGGLILDLAADGAAAAARRPPPPLDAVTGNEGIEALVDLPDGRLLAITEAALAGSGRALAVAFAPGRPTTVASWRPEPGYAATGAARLGDRLFVLERRVSFVSGVSAVVKELPATAFGPGAVLDGTVVARLDAVGFGANLEGIDVGPAPGGRVDLYLVSDDNFGVLLPAVFLQVRLPPVRPPPAP
jgi:hypothetical protein